MTRPATRIDDEVWAAACALIQRTRTAVLVCHVSPDGDALGSMMALAFALRGLGLDVRCTWGDERWTRPPAWDWLPGIGSVVPPSEVPTDPDLLVVLDTGARDRLGVLAGLPDTAASVLVIDHHTHGSDIDRAVHCVDPAAAATAVVVEELLRRLEIPVDAGMATCLYTGLVTDTGSFRHAVTTPEVHQVAARLLSAGARPDEVASRIWGTRPFGVVRLLASALARATVDPAAVGGRGMVWTTTTAADLEDNGLVLEDADSAMEVIRVSGEADVAVLLKQGIDGVWKASTRSRGATDVGSACAALGGGGHRLAAGFTVPPELADAGPAAVIDRFTDLLG
jgi:phosphoesterase RecJ-like protein